MKNMKKKGFTLVELLVVIAIIAILATVSVVGYTAFLAKANQSNAQTEANQVAQAIKADLMAGNDYVIGTVENIAAEDGTVAEGDTQTTYYVDAENGKIRAEESKYYAADDAATADVVEVVGWNIISDTEITSTAEDDVDAFTALVKTNPDFAGFQGTFAVTGSGVITYTYVEGITAEIELN